MSKQEKAKVASQFVFYTFIILTLTTLLGSKVLQSFGISMSAFMVAGGGVLAGIGFKILLKSQSEPDNSPPSEEVKKKSIAPLILFAASPGSITGVITLSVANNTNIPITTLLAITTALIITWCVLIASIYYGKNEKSEGVSLTKRIMTSFMGLIILSMGVQLALTGLHSFSVG